MFANKTAGRRRWGILVQGCRWLKLEEGRDQRYWECVSIKTTRISDAVPSFLSDIGLSSGFFVDWLKKASEAERLMEGAESEPMVTVEVGVETAFVRVGNGRFDSVAPGWHTVSAVALPTLITLPWHLERGRGGWRKRERESDSSWVQEFCLK